MKENRLKWILLFRRCSQAHAGPPDELSQRQSVSLDWNNRLGSGVVCSPADLPYDPAKGFGWAVPPASSAGKGWVASLSVGLGSNPMTQSCLSISATSLPEAKYNHPFPGSQKFQSDGCAQCQPAKERLTQLRAKNNGPLVSMDWRFFFPLLLGLCLELFFVLMLDFILFCFCHLAVNRVTEEVAISTAHIRLMGLVPEVGQDQKGIHLLNLSSHLHKRRV